jgi:PPK2 family polyphosphate:nucleotide phosphotransferase
MAEHLARRFRIDRGTRFRLADHAPDDRGRLESKEDAEALLADLNERLEDLQYRLFASARWSLLIVFQGMDAAGKDGAIRHALASVDPQGCRVHSFRAPSEEELAHDFLWRCARRLPERGQIGVFNRSHYEEVLVVRVHKELLQPQRLPKGLVTRSIWNERLEDIVAFERHLARSGTAILKFFLNVSRAEQRRRFLERLDEPEKNWKFRARDVEERKHWNAYRTAYEQAIRATSFPYAPWFVVPADEKWVTRAVVCSAIVERLETLDLSLPPLSRKARAELARARARLHAGG